MVLSGPGALARELVVGNCQNGQLSSTHHEDPVTGETTVTVCSPLGPIDGN
jgi:hypothetical protein